MNEDDGGIEVDEDESKIRRNLVWLSSVIVGWWFLGINLTEVTKKLIGAEKIDHPTRIWIVVFLLMYYVAARFCNTKNARGAWKQLRSLRRDVFWANVQKQIADDVNELHAYQSYDAKFIDNDAVKARLDELEFPQKDLVAQGLLPNQVDLKWNGIDYSRVRRSAGTVEIALSVGLREKDESRDQSRLVSIINVPYHFPTWPHRWFAIKTYTKLFFWDNEVTYFVFPIALWYLAALITAYNLSAAVGVWAGW